MSGKQVLRGVAKVGLCAAFLASAAVATAGTEDGKFAVEEGGRVSCPAFLKARADKSQSYARSMGFVEGYLTAANRYERNTFDLTPWHTPAAISLILEQHCTKHPQDNLALAVQRLVVAMAPVRLATFSDMVEVGDTKNKAFVYKTILRRAQSELSRKGLYNGVQNGEFTPEVRTAIEQFQILAKLDPTGVPDPATLWVLLNP